MPSSEDQERVSPHGCSVGKLSSGCPYRVCPGSGGNPVVEKGTWITKLASSRENLSLGVFDHV